MDNIIYEEEQVTEQVFEGDLILDGHMSPKQQEEYIFNMMRAAGVEVHDKSEYSIGYDGAEDDNGISETQYSHFVVTRTYKKQVPYKVTREEVYSGEWILDGLRITPEERRQRIFDMMRKDGVDVSNQDELEIGYEGANDDMGISETQVSKFTVFRVKKEKVTDAFHLDDELSQDEKMQRIYDELVALRERVQKSNDSNEITELSNRIMEISDLLDNMVIESSRDYSPFEKTLAEIDEQIKTIQTEISAKMKDYLESYERIKEILGDQTETLKSELTPEEFDQKISELMQEKMAENEESLSVRKDIDLLIRELEQLIKKKDRVRKDFEAAEQLGLSALEYKELTDNFRSRKLVNAIIEKKGLGDILAVPAKERTPEQKRRIKQIRKEIFDELARSKKEHEDQSILNLVEALYGIETQVKLTGKQRVLIVKAKSLENIKKNASKMPEKIKGADEINITYKPGEVPEDMKEVMENNQKEEVIPYVEKVIPYEEKKDTIDRRILPEEESEEFIPGTNFHKPRVRGVYETDDEYVAFLKSYYDRIFGITDQKSTEKEEVMPYEESKVKEKVIPYQERVMPYEEKKEDVIPYVERIIPYHEKRMERFTIFNDIEDNNHFYARKYVFDRFAITPIGEGVRVAGALCYPIDPIDVASIEENANNEMSPYIVEHVDVKLAHKAVKKQEDVVDEDVLENRTGLKDRIVIYKDTEEHNKYYVYKSVFDRFDAEAIGEEVRLDGIAGYEISPEDVHTIVSNQDNELSPYEVEFRNITLAKEKVKTLSNDSFNREEIFEGDFVLDGHVTPEQQRDTVLRMMRDAGVEVEDEDDLEIGYEGVTDDNGISETQKTHFVVYRKPKEEKQEEVVEDKKEEEKQEEVVEDKKTEEKQEEVVEDKKEEEKQDDDITPPPTVVEDEAMDNRGLTDLVVIYRDTEIPNTYYAYKPVFDRFAAEEVGDEVRLDGIAGYGISPEDVQYIVSNQENDLSPYKVEFRDIALGKKKNSEDTMDNRRELTDVVVIYRDKDIPNKYYAYKPVFDRFDAEEVGEEVRLNGIAGYEISPEDVQYIVSNQENDVSPYRVEFRDISLDHTRDVVPPVVDTDTPVKDTETPVKDIETPVKDTDTPVKDIDTPVKDTDSLKDKTETITLYRDLNDNNQVYAPDDVLKKFGIKALAAPTMINGVPCHKISRDTDQIINSIARMSKTPKLVVKYVDVHIKKIEETKPRPHVESILDKLTTDLDIRAKDAKHYKASNLKLSRGFKEELHSGNFAYNIVHIVPAILKAGVGLFRKLAGKLMTTPRARDAMETIESRLGELSEEELDVLFEEYKGSQLKTDMNNQINPLILDRLRQYGLARVEKLNEAIRADYTMLFTLLGQIRALEEKIQKSGKDSGSLENQRQALMKQAAVHVRSIINNRNKANNLLSSGVHGIEEDFKAVATKMNYVGLRFAKTNDFDNDLQHQLGMLGRRLNTALANGDDEAIVLNFMGLESCYYENTEIRGSLAGKRSVGSKYYSPVAEQFDYRDDPFIRDLFTTVAVCSAAVSAVNAVRVHQIESQQLLRDQQAQANTVNAHNQATMNYVHQTGQRISDKRGTFQEGMEAQAQQDILTNADVRERAHLDLSNWSFNDAYHAADHAGHDAYNQFNIDVTNQINAVTADYAQGLITQAEALQRMSQISSDAQATLNSVVDSSLAILRPYAASHPQFDLTAVQQSMEYIVAHPNAIADMNQAMVEVTNLADGLQGLQMMPMSALSELPSDMASTIVCAASACLLASNVASSLTKAPKKGTYGNEITDMMDNYLYGAEEEKAKEKTR